MSRQTDDDPYSFGSAFSDDADAEPEPSKFSNPFATPDMTPTLSTDPTSTLSFPAPSLDHARLSQIAPATIAPALGVYASPAPGLDYVFAEDYSAQRKKSGGEQLTYLAGGSYLAGALVGGGVGLASAVRDSAGKTGKLRLNAILNATGRQGARAANSLAVLALTFSIAETVIHNASGDDGVANYAAAGAVAGAVFKSTRGLKVAGAWGVAGAAVAVGAVYASREGIYGRRVQGIL